jgi:hypothetical protein
VTVELPIDGLQAEDIMGNPVVMEGNRLLLSHTGRPVILYPSDSASGKSLFAVCEPLDRKHLGFVTTGSDGEKIYQLPETWRGDEKGSSSGNPVLSDGKPIWRLDGLYPNDRILPQNYTPMVWGNQNWIAAKGTQGGHPSAKLQDGVLSFGAMGPWGGKTYGFKKQGSLSFIVPEDGTYRVQTDVQSKPWGGGKKAARVYMMKRDEQRVGLIETRELPADGTSVALDVEIDAAAGHEIVFLTEMPHWNNGTNIRFSNLVITCE